jgi:DNA-binding CsgD family transcriptional regulator
LRWAAAMDFHRAKQWFEDAEAVARNANHLNVLATTYNNLGYIDYELGNDTTARSRYDAAIALINRLEYHFLTWSVHCNLCMLHVRRREWPEASGHGLVALRSALDTGSPLGAHSAIEYLGFVNAHIGSPERAARLFGRFDAWLLQPGSVPIPYYRRERAAARASVEASLGTPEYLTMLTVGAACTPEQLQGELESESWLPPESPLAAPNTSHREGAPRASKLTEREREVLRLLCRGLTTRETALQLVLSSRTVETHLANVYAKLGARNRAEALVAALRSGELDA